MAGPQARCSEWYTPLIPSREARGIKLARGFHRGKKDTFLPIPTHCTTLRLTPNPFSLPICLPSHFTHHTLYGAHKELHCLYWQQSKHPGEYFTEIFSWILQGKSHWVQSSPTDPDNRYNYQPTNLYLLLSKKKKRYMCIIWVRAWRVPKITVKQFWTHSRIAVLSNFKMY